MANVTLYPPGQKPKNFQDATELTLNQGVLMFFAIKEDSETTIARHITNMPFLWTE
jgi:hypothetical protein